MQDTSPQGVDIEEAVKQIRLHVDTIMGVEKCGDDFFRSLEGYINWSFAACLATLLWFVGSIDKFKVNGEFYNKYSFVLTAALLLASVICFGIYRYVLHYHAIAKADLLNGVGMLSYGVQKYKRPNGNEEIYTSQKEILEHISAIRETMKDLDNFTERWGGRRSQVLESGGIFFFLTGVVLAGVYIISLTFSIDEAYIIQSTINRLT